MTHKNIPLTDVEKIRRLPWLVAGDSLNTAFFLLTFSGSVFILFLNELGLDAAQIGVMLSLVPLAGIVAPFMAPWVGRYGYKRTFITFWGIRNFVFALMLLTPLILGRFGEQKVFFWVAGIILVFALCRAIAETGSYPWRKEAVPDAIRGKFIALNSMSTTVAGILVTVGASYVIDIGDGLSRFMILMTTGITIGLISLWVYAQVPGGAKKPSSAETASHVQGMKQSLRDGNFVRFLISLGLITIGATAVISFVPLFMTEQVGLSDGNVVLLSVGTYLGALVSSYWWGWVADRYGSQPIMQFSIIILLLLPLGWLLVPRYSAYSLPIAFFIAFVTGIGTLAWQISWVRYLFVNVMPPDNSSPYSAVYYAWFGFVSGLGPLLVGQLLTLMSQLQVDFWLLHIDPYTPVFGLSLLLLLTGLVTISRLRGDGATPFRRLAGMFLRGNPIRALESLVQYNFAASEDTRMATTERMGDAGNPLSTFELIEALKDPSFNVRYEAIHAIGRMPPEPELVEALLAALDEGKSELSFVITRSLGRLGDPQAIEPLRRLLFSGYHLLEANAARALAMLGDHDSVPPILEKFQAEPNRVLKIAYVSALGQLGVVQAVPDIFALLRQTRNETYRAEIGLALARIAGEETYYMQHWPSLKGSTTTATAQAILALQKTMASARQEQLARQMDPCAAGFAQGDLAAGARQLHTIIKTLLPVLPAEPPTAILAECATDLAHFDPDRLEVILLSLHTLDIALRQIGQPLPPHELSSI
ncbi:MAG: MFS transporter [Anaerolineaceae bacterium]|nr:MFS transporter [Anaerolineaceae bacterium]MCB9099771.1 MFS transporter [Anaerolineales bacterium]